MITMQIGDRVAYSVKFLRATGMFAGPIPHARGTIVALEPMGDRAIATVDWNNPAIPRRILTANLTLVSRIAVDSALNT